MLRNLFEEYRFFHQYPDKELHTTAVFFGSIIDQGLVTLVSHCAVLIFAVNTYRHNLLLVSD